MSEAARRALHVLVVANPVAPRADLDKLKAALAAVFDPVGLSHRVVLTSKRSNACAILDRQIERAANAQCRLVVAAGGDGTVSIVADRLSRRPASSTPMRLGIVPLGTANILARELELPIDLETAIAVIAQARRTVTVDAIELGERRFFTQVGIGLDARMIEATSREAQQKFKQLAYLGALLRRAFGHRSVRFNLTVDRHPVRVRAWQVLLANASTLGAPPFRWGPDIDPSDGVLDLCVYRVNRLQDFIGLFWSVLRGHHGEDPRADFFSVHREVTIVSAQPLPVQGDGDLMGQTPVTLRVVPHAVEVVVPESPAQAITEDAARSVRAGGTSSEGSALRRGGSGFASVPRQVRARIAQHVLVKQIATLGAVDAALFLKVNAIPSPPIVDRAMALASRLLDHGEAWIAVSVVAALADPARHRWLPLVLAPTLWLTMYVANHPLKSLFRRRRPFVAYIRARVLGPKPSDSSFPSGHTAVAFAGAIILTSAIPLLAPAVFAYAALVGWSRVHLGVHYPSDVVIGAALGSLLGIAGGALMRVVLPI